MGDVGWEMWGGRGLNCEMWAGRCGVGKGLVVRCGQGDVGWEMWGGRCGEGDVGWERV